MVNTNQHLICPWGWPTSYRLIFAISSSIWFWTAMPWPFSAVLSPSSAVLTANERRELTDGRRAAGCRIDAAKDVDREWEFMALWPS